MTTTKAPGALVRLANELARAKREEEEAKATRIEAEQAIIKACGFDKPEGQETFEAETDAGSACRVVLKQPINTTFDGSGWPALRLKLPESARRAVVTDYKLDAKNAREVQEKDKTSWAAISQLVTRKPGKVSVSVGAISIVEGDDFSATEQSPPPVEAD